MKHRHRWRTAVGFLAAVLTALIRASRVREHCQRLGRGGRADTARDDSGLTAGEGGGGAGRRAPTAASGERPGDAEPGTWTGRADAAFDHLQRRDERAGGQRAGRRQPGHRRRARPRRLGRRGPADTGRSALRGPHHLRIPVDRFEAALDAARHARHGGVPSRSDRGCHRGPCWTSMSGSPRSRPASTGYARCSPAPRPSVRWCRSRRELTRRETELASLKTRKERLADLVALSTITVTLRGPAAPSADEEPETGFIAGLKDGWEASSTSVQVVLTVAGWLLPWAIAIGLPDLAARSGCSGGAGRPWPWRVLSYRGAQPYRQVSACRPLHRSPLPRPQPHRRRRRHRRGPRPPGPKIRAKHRNHE